MGIFEKSPYRGPYKVGSAIKNMGLFSANMNYFEYQYGQASNMPKFNHEKHEICLVPKKPCVRYNEQQLFQTSNMPRSLMTNMNIFEHQ